MPGVQARFDADDVKVEQAEPGINLFVHQGRFAVFNGLNLEKWME